MSDDLEDWLNALRKPESSSDPKMVTEMKLLRDAIRDSRDVNIQEVSDLEVRRLMNSIQNASPEVEQFLLQAAASDSEESILLKSDTGHWNVTIETTSDAERILVFSCEQELLQSYEGRRVLVQIGGIEYDLGYIDKRGIAEVEISREVNLHADVVVSITSA